MRKQIYLKQFFRLFGVLFYLHIPKFSVWRSLLFVLFFLISDQGYNF